MSLTLTIQEARAGSGPALGAVLEACREYITAVAVRQVPKRLHRRVPPSSLVQETYVRACGQFARFRGQSERQLVAWLRRIMLNCLLNHLRRPECQVHVGEVTDECECRQPPPEQRAADGEAGRAVREAIDRLPAHYRLVIQLRHFERLEFEEIGRLLDLTGEAVRKLWVRAQAKLGNELRAFQ